MTAAIPGPTSNTLGLDFLGQFKTDPLGTMTHLKDEFGDIVNVKFGPVNWLLCNHPDHIKEVFVTNWRTYGKTDRFKQILSSVDGQGLVLTEGDFWLRQRRIIQPSFNHERLVKDYALVMEEETNRHIANWRDGMELNLHDEMTALTLKVTSRVFFDVDASSEAQVLADAVSVVSKILYQEFNDIVPLPDWLPLPTKAEKRKAVETIDRFIYKVIEKHKNDPGGNTVVAMLLNAKDVEGDGKGMSDRQVRDEAITMFNAGHDSTAAALTWTWYELLRHKDIYRQFLEQVDSASGNKIPDLTSLSAIPLAEQSVKEALRLYPPAWLLPRQCNQDVELAGYQLKKGYLINMSPFVMQRDARFFENPNEFNPSRFAPDKEKAMYPFSFFPFGAGPRSCIGREFALMEMQLLMAIISQRFEFILHPDSKNVQLNPMVSLEPKDGVKATIVERKRGG